MEELLRVLFTLLVVEVLQRLEQMELALQQELVEQEQQQVLIIHQQLMLVVVAVVIVQQVIHPLHLEQQVVQVVAEQVEMLAVD